MTEIMATGITTVITKASTMYTAIMTGTRCVAGMAITTAICLRGSPRETACHLDWNGG